MLCTIYLIALAVLLVVSVFLIMWPHYEDGLIGKLCLIVIAITSAAVLVGAWDGVQYQPIPETVAVAVGAAGFMTRHLYHFARFAITGRHAWHKSESDEC